MNVFAGPVVGLNCHTFTAAVEIEELGVPVLPPLDEIVPCKLSTRTCHPERLSKDISI